MIKMNLTKLLELYKSLNKYEQRFLQLCSLLVGDDEWEWKSNFKHILPILKKLAENSLTESHLQGLISRYKKMKLWDSEINGVTINLMIYLNQQSFDHENPDFKENIEFIEKLVPSLSDFTFHYWRTRANYRFVIYCLFINDIRIFKTFSSTSNEVMLYSLFTDLVLESEIDFDWLSTRDKVFQALICSIKLSHAYDGKTNYFTNSYVSLISYLEFYDKNNQFLDHNLPFSIELRLMCVDIITNKISNINHRGFGVSNKEFFQEIFISLSAFSSGDFKKSLQKMEKAFVIFERVHEQKRVMLFTHYAILLIYVINLLAMEKYTKITTSIIKPLERNCLRYLAYPYEALNLILECDYEDAITLLEQKKQHLNDVPTTSLIRYAVHNWILYLANNEHLDINEFKQKFEASIKSNNTLTSHLLAELISKYLGQDDYLDFLKNSPFGSLRILSLVKVKQPWEFVLEKLEQITNNLPNKNNSTSKLIWIINTKYDYIKPQEQILLKNSSWGVPKDISRSKLPKLIESASVIDSKALRYLVHSEYYSGSLFTYNKEILFALVGNPNVYLEGDPPLKIDLVTDQVQLNVNDEKPGFRLKLNYFSLDEKIFLVRQSNTRYSVVNYTTELANIGRILGEKGLVVPRESKDKILNVICNNSNNQLKIHADFEDENITTIAADCKYYAQIIPLDDGINVSLLVNPFTPYEDSYFYPRYGQESLLVEASDGTRQKIVRNFKQELKLVNEICAFCPSLGGKEHSWNFTDLESSLSVLEELADYKQQHDNLEIQWPKGKTLDMKQKVTNSNLSLRVSGEQNYFEFSGEITLDDGKVVAMKSLLELLDTNPDSKFIRLDDGSFIALTNNFRQQLEELKQASFGNKVFGLSSNSLQNLIEATTNVELDKTWKDHVKRLASRKKHNPVVPSTLQTELRDYQQEGFKYLSTLANWQIGACLADDMGLGKTVQGIALMLEQAHNGPILIIAPTSVCFNWEAELQKFAPTLKVHTAYNNYKRESLIKELESFDVLICSYGLLPSLEATLVDKEWHLVVIDEAQAIKNYNTKRWGVVSKLKSTARIALTGTPIENHLGELWSICHFLNPGLLGTLNHFQKKFITPISNSNQIAKTALKNIVKPYILRRTKTQVLSELPPKIEQSILIEPTADEIAFYEALKVRALEKLKELGDGNNRISILAELTKLRQACCHSTLIDPSIKISNSKLEALLELVLELKDNNHRALIFSQYVGYLKIVQKLFDDNKISYKYIDGSTPLPKRKQNVNEFQDGDGDVFLISLKAGGTGLNLTAADYVIILDPWWNPSVEDQAADRAHRIGQKRPVTVYRMITKGTIEEKIVKLHQNKRDLASDLLEGQDIGAKISDDELLGLIR